MSGLRFGSARSGCSSFQAMTSLRVVMPGTGSKRVMNSAMFDGNS